MAIKRKVSSIFWYERDLHDAMRKCSNWLRDNDVTVQDVSINDQDGYWYVTVYYLED